MEISINNVENTPTNDMSKFHKLNENDNLAICDVGAYGMVLSSNYNLRTKPAEILINKSSFKLITKRQKLFLPY